MSETNTKTSETKFKKDGQTNQSRLFDALDKISKDHVVVRPEDYIEIKVQINPTNLLNSYSQALWHSWDNNLVKGSLPFSEFELQTMLKYVIHDLIQKKTSNRWSKIDWQLPDFIYALCDKLGIVTDVAQGITLVPESKIIETFYQENKLIIDGAELKPEEFMKEMAVKVNNLIKIYKNYAPIIIIERFPKGHTGDIALMSMWIVDDMVKCTTAEHHAVYALLSASLNLQVLDTVIKPRIIYCDTKTLEGAFHGIVGTHNK